jgi:dTDP-4-amino-4,6-dideoxygalactose transaminase
MINVTKTYLPSLEEYTRYLEKIWESNQLTNYGQLYQELELKLLDYLGVRHICFVANGTIALQIAIKALDLHGDILTTPFSYVASTSSIIWEGCRPVFVDIHPETLTLDPDLIEAAITPRTTSILATHVYGYPCAVERIQEIAQNHNLKVIYDAAHAFGVRYKGTSLLNYGDISTLSFHATKLFHTGEGGALVTNDDDLARRIEYMANFGHKGREEFWGLGINGKNSELHAAMGLCILPKVQDLIAGRKVICDLYDVQLKGTNLTRPKCPPDTDYNSHYYPVLFESQESLLKAMKALNDKSIFPRRYFYPSLNTLPYVANARMEISEDVSARILCLPLSNYLSPGEVNLICNTIITSLSME